MDSVAEYVDGCIDGMTQRSWVGNAFTSDVEAWIVVGGGDYEGESRLHLHAKFLGLCFEGYIALVVVHCQNAIEAGLKVVAKEIICSIRTIDLNTSFLNGFEGRTDNVLFFSSQLWVEGQYGNTGVVDTKITL